jgi:hypothetical protein
LIVKVILPLSTFCLALLIYCSTSIADTPSMLNAVPDSESYALYSSIYRNSNWLEPDEIVGIAAKAIAVAREGCLKPVTKEERMMVDAASTLSAYHPEWKRRFDFGHVYRLIRSAETNKATDCISGSARGGDLPGCEAYAKMRFVRFLSIPVFNRDHTRALVAISRVCGGLCGNGSLQVFRRTRGGWELEPDSFAKCLRVY